MRIMEMEACYVDEELLSDYGHLLDEFIVAEPVHAYLGFIYNAVPALSCNLQVWGNELQVL
jgi:hypothetical protein